MYARYLTIHIIFNMNGYPKKIFYYHVKQYLSEKLLTTISCQNINDDKNTVIIPCIGNPSMIFKVSSTRIVNALKSKDVVQYLKHAKMNVKLH